MKAFCMEPTTDKNAATAGQREALRRELLKLIVRNEVQRRDGHKATDK
jgi:hypothetical protein